MAQKRSLKDRLAESPDAEADEVEDDDQAEEPEVEEEQPEVEEEAPKAARSGTKADYKAALKWAIEMIGHPSEQWGSCPAHGKVPFTHQCASYANVEYAHAVELAGLADDAEDSG